MNTNTESTENKGTINTTPLVSSDSENEEISVTEDKEIEIVDTIPTRGLPNVNVPEKIIICFDVCSEDLKPDEDLDNDSMDTLISVLNFYLHTKQAINAKTEFSLVILKESEAEWAVDFTSHIDELVIYLNDYTPDPCTKTEFNISQLFNLVYRKKDLCEVVKPDFNVVPPVNFVRMLVMYRRSSCVPKLIDNRLFENIFKEYPYFMFDVLYCHEQKYSEFKCEEIYNAFQSLDNGYSYMFEAENCEQDLREIGAKLLAHPLQRPPQKFASYVI